MQRPEHIRKKHRARRRVEYAVQTGRLRRPSYCEACGMAPAPMKDGRAPIQAHHYRGYDFPLEVQWLCTSCHVEETDYYKSTITHCPAGHPYSGDNLYVGPTRGDRRCRACARARDQLRECGWERSKNAAA